jgi:hypothetical protein
MGSKADRWTVYKKLMDEGAGGEKDEASIPDRWTDADEAKLDALKNEPIEMGDTAYGRFEAQKKGGRLAGVYKDVG